jgi:hypothetical protein
MTKQAKKEQELTILRTVFKKKRFPKYIFSEKPDFIVHHKKDFGVEITEYYPDETMARMHNRPNYAQEVTNKTYIHKDDAQILEVVNTEYFNEKKQKWIKLEVPAVMQENQPIQLRVQRLIDQINDKTKLYHTYNSSLSDIDLIVCDSRASFIDGINDNYMRSIMKEIFARNIFRLSGFRNIYLSIPGYKERSTEIFQLK